MPSMTQIIAIVRRNRASATTEELTRIGCAGYSRFSVLGRGRQLGLRGAKKDEQGPAFLPKVLFDLVVEDERVDETVEAITRANQTGHYGDGRIFLVEVTASHRISTATAGTGIVAQGGES